MNISVAKVLLLLAALTLAVPESYAKRMGGGRSAGRQSQVVRQRPAPPPSSPAPVQRTQPDTARQSVPPAAPQQQSPRQASSPWGGMLGGALLGLGLGSLMGAGNRDTNPATNPANQTEGGSEAGSSASGAGETPANATQAAAQPAEQVQENRFGSVLLLGLLAAVVFFLVRRARSRARGRGF